MRLAAALLAGLVTGCLAPPDPPTAWLDLSVFLGEGVTGAVIRVHTNASGLAGRFELPSGSIVLIPIEPGGYVLTAALRLNETTGSIPSVIHTVDIPACGLTAQLTRGPPEPRWSTTRCSSLTPPG